MILYYLSNIIYTKGSIVLSVIVYLHCVATVTFNLYCVTTVIVYLHCVATIMQLYLNFNIIMQCTIT